MLDKVLAVISLAGLITFVSILMVYVAEIDLTIITVVVLIMAVFDFYLLTRSPPKSDR
jgi:hypothetical protein